MRIELRRPHVSSLLLWLEHKEAFPDGHAYSQFCERYRRWRCGVDVVMHQEQKAGDKLFVDFPGRQIPIYDQAPGVPVELISSRRHTCISISPRRRSR